MMSREDMGKRIQLKRKEANLTQGELAEQLGVSRQTVHMWEVGKVRIPETRREMLCSFFHTHPGYFTDGGSNPDDTSQETSVLSQKTICPFMRVACLTEGCMAWRWIKESKYVYGNPGVTFPKCDWRGYCGLAGKPES